MDDDGPDVVDLIVCSSGPNTVQPVWFLLNPRNSVKKFCQVC